MGGRDLRLRGHTARYLVGRLWLLAAQGADAGLVVQLQACKLGWRRSGQDEQRPDIVTRPRNAIPTTHSSTPATLSGQPRASSRWPALQRAAADAVPPHQRVSGRAQKPRPRAWMRRFQMGPEIQTRAALSTGRAFTLASTLPSHRRDILPTETPPPTPLHPPSPSPSLIHCHCSCATQTPIVSA